MTIEKIILHASKKDFVAFTESIGEVVENKFDGVLDTTIRTFKEFLFAEANKDDDGEKPDKDDKEEKDEKDDVAEEEDADGDDSEDDKEDEDKKDKKDDKKDMKESNQASIDKMKASIASAKKKGLPTTQTEAELAKLLKKG